MVGFGGVQLNVLGVWGSCLIFLAAGYDNATPSYGHVRAHDGVVPQYMG